MLKPFNIIFHKGTTPIARFIRILTKSKYSHVAICIDALHLIQLDWKTPVSIHHLNYPVGHYDIYEVNIELTETEKLKILKYMRNRIHTTYDWKFILSRFFNIIIGTPLLNSDRKYNCDELIIEAYRSIGVNLTDEKMSPDSLSRSKFLIKIEEIN